MEREITEQNTVHTKMICCEDSIRARLAGPKKKFPPKPKTAGPLKP